MFNYSFIKIVSFIIKCGKKYGTGRHTIILLIIIIGLMRFAC